MPPAPLLSIGELSRRSGLSVSAIRFYEARGLVKAIRTRGNQRRFARRAIFYHDRKINEKFLSVFT